jgi:AcrR family transcriptional regulator
MATVRKRSADGLTSAERILERAIAVIESGGEVAIRTNTIAEECGVSPPILYRAFGSREGLLVAAQAERYRRTSTLAAEFLLAQVSSASSRDDLREKLDRSLTFIFSPERAVGRRLGVEVIGSAVSRPLLREAIVTIDNEYADRIVEAYREAIARGWVVPAEQLRAVALWAQALVTSLVTAEFGQTDDMRERWITTARAAIMRAVFGD